MSYNVNGKVYTEHPLMDEIIFNCKIIVKDLVVKNDELANYYEDEDTIYNFEIFSIIKEGNMNFNLLPITFENLRAFGYDSDTARAILVNRDNTPVEDRDSLVEFITNYFLDHFEEKNKYYRMLIGLPEYGTDEYNIYINNSYLPSNYNKEVDFSKPLHELDKSVIAILESTGKIDKIIEENKGFNYSYLRFLGDKSLDLYTVRKAFKWDILYIPAAEAIVQDRFIELYNLNKEIYLKRTYQDSYSFNSDYYEQCMILLVICQTFTDMIVDVPEWYIRRDIFDIRSVQYFLDSFGVKFFKEIPLKYQIRIVKNLNKLIKFKSTNQNNNDILEIFDLKDTSIYKYYLYKKELYNGEYDLEFVQCKLGDTYDNYIKDQIYRTPYDDITYQDKYWDGEDSHEYIKNLHLNRDFTIEGTKYMSIEYKIDMKNYLFQMQYLLGLFLSSDLDTNDITIPVPSIQPSINFKLSNLFLLLILISLSYDNANTSILRPEDFDFTTSKRESNIKYNENYYDWMKKYYPELFVDGERRVYGFNSKVDLEKVEEIISRRHSQYQFDNGFTLEELGVDTYIPPKKVTSINELMNIYNTNKQCYDNLKDKIVNTADDRDEFMVYNFVFETLFTRDFDYDYYTINDGKINAEYLEEILKEKDFILYNLFNKLNSEPNPETKKDNIRSIMNDIISTLEYYLSYDGTDYIFSFTSIASFNALIHYIYLMIDFFKSYKVYFLDPYITYVFDDKYDNIAGAKNDAIAERRLTYEKEDREFHRDNSSAVIGLNFEEVAEHERIKEVLDIYGHFEPDPDDDYDYNGMYADTNLQFKDANGGYADGRISIPYIVINGGPAQGSRRDLWDINGAGALEMQQYVDVNGGYTKHIDDWKKDYWGNSFRYIIDGGGASTNNFFTRSMHMQVIDEQISARVRVSKLQYNNIVETKDGLYLKQIWSSWEDFDSTKNDIENMFEYYSYMYDKLHGTIELSYNLEAIDKEIEKCIDTYIGGLKIVTSYMDNQAFENSLKEYTDEKISTLYSEFFNFSPIDYWSDF